MLRMAFAIVVLASIQMANPNRARATEGPWCALRNFGSDLSEDCQFRTFEECRETVIAGFRGFCNQNPRWQSENTTPRRPRKG